MNKSKYMEAARMMMGHADFGMTARYLSDLI